jgi:checkpoint serine/threonine-protein kinase
MDAEVIYQFLEANEIGQSHAAFYSSYALHMEKKSKFRKADEIFNLGIARYICLFTLFIKLHRLNLL